MIPQASYRVIVDGTDNKPVVIDGCASMERAATLKAALDPHFPRVRIEEIIGPLEDGLSRTARIASAMLLE